ncbi:MAG TPA: hypothetical protein VF469_12060 [Kofleriaceae bacterium]
MSAGAQAATAALSESPTSPQTPAETPTPIERVLDEIRADAARDPERYARETIVPKGGE